jgi:hypothetical protein
MALVFCWIEVGERVSWLFCFDSGVLVLVVFSMSLGYN